ncbi:MAG: HAD-IC family P-type ATPase, partial [Deltaproteobacteria bacterium]|nr:HAD-IC family P-type ATPase [Deltaproteobacteria bacterium]
MNHWHQITIQEVVSTLKSDKNRGLSKSEANRRLAEYGLNELEAAHRISPWIMLGEQFKNILIIILIIAIFLSVFLGHTVEAIAISVIMLFAVLLGFIQEYRAERALEALKIMAAPTATVIRDGEEEDIPARDLVPGDILLFRAGDRISADSRLIEAVNLQVEEAPLTGESVPVEKQAAALEGAELAIGDRKNMAYSGTVVTYGRGRSVVVATGMQTEFGKIAKLLQGVETGKTPLQQNLDRVGHLLARAAIVVVLLIVALGFFRGQPLLEMLIFGIALAVAVVPEALPAVVTISLAIGVQRMVKRNALIRRLPAVETLGCTSVICSDKTGTLTKDEMTIRKIFVAGKMLEVSGSGYEPHGQFLNNGSAIQPFSQLNSLLRAGVLASDAHLTREGESGHWHVKGDPTEGALVVVAAKASLHRNELEGQFPRVNEIPFTSETKRMTTLNESPEGLVAYSKGAPEVILNSCTGQLTEKGEVSLSTSEKETILLSARQMAGEALRVLAVAQKPNANLESAEKEMIFLGLVGMIDPPRSEAKGAVQVCKEAGIKPVMITGDHPLTAQAIARELGILN